MIDIESESEEDSEEEAEEEEEEEEDFDIDKTIHQFKNVRKIFVHHRRSLSVTNNSHSNNDLVHLYHSIYKLICQCL